MFACLGEWESQTKTHVLSFEWMFLCRKDKKNCSVIFLKLFFCSLISFSESMTKKWTLVGNELVKNEQNSPRLSDKKKCTELKEFLQFKKKITIASKEDRIVAESNRMVTIVFCKFWFQKNQVTSVWTFQNERFENWISESIFSE